MYIIDFQLHQLHAIKYNAHHLLLMCTFYSNHNGANYVYHVMFYMLTFTTKHKITLYRVRYKIW